MSVPLTARSSTVNEEAPIVTREVVQVPPAADASQITTVAEERHAASKRAQEATALEPRKRKRKNDDVCQILEKIHQASKNKASALHDAIVALEDVCQKSAEAPILNPFQKFKVKQLFQQIGVPEFFLQFDRLRSLKGP